MVVADLNAEGGQAVADAIDRVKTSRSDAPIIAVGGGKIAPSLLERAAATGVPVELRPGESFLDLLVARVGLDPLSRGLQVLAGRNLPDPLPLDYDAFVKAFTSAAPGSIPGTGGAAERSKQPGSTHNGKAQK